MNNIISSVQASRISVRQPFTLVNLFDSRISLFS